MTIRKQPNGKWLCECYPSGRDGKRSWCYLNARIVTGDIGALRVANDKALNVSFASAGIGLRTAEEKR